jgi:hypothetical protein
MSEEQQEVIEESTDSVTSDVITKEQAEQYGLSKNMIGQPKENLFEAYSNLQKFDTRLSQSVNELKTELRSLKDQLPAKEATKIINQAEKEVIDEIGDPPEQYEYDNVAQYKTALKKYIEKAANIKAQAIGDAIEVKLDKKYGERIAANEQAANDAQAERDINITLNTLEDSLSDLYDGELPEGVSADSIMDEWNNSFTKEESDRILATGYYSRNPNKMAKDIITFYKAHQFDKEKVSPKNAAEKATINIKQKLKDKAMATKLATSSRTKPTVEKSAMGSLADRLEAEAEWNKPKE